MLAMIQKVSARLIIRNEQNVLLKKRQTGDVLYELPGGELPFGEEPKAFLQTLAQSSIGPQIQAIQLFDVISAVIRPGVQELTVVFLGTFAEPGTAVKAPYFWIPLQNIQPNDLDNLSQAVLKVPKSNLPEPQQHRANELAVQNTTISSGAKEVLIYSDGGSRGNPGPSASGFVILGHNDQVLYEGGEYLGITTNNQAEYQAVRLALKKALELGARVVKFRMDSLLIVNQMVGLYQIRNRELWPIYANIQELIKKFDNVTFHHVRREFNKDADALVNKILDEKQQ